MTAKMRRSLPPVARRAVAFCFDLGAVAFAWLLAFAFRFSFEMSWAQGASHAAVAALAWLIPLHGAVFWKLGLYRGIWMFASIPDLARIMRSIGVAWLASLIVVISTSQLGLIPRSVIFLYPVFLIGMMSGARLAYRAGRERLIHRHPPYSAEPVLVIGAGMGGAHLIKDLRHSSKWWVVGVLDDDPHKKGLFVCGKEVLDTSANVGFWAEEMGVRHAILAIPSAPAEVRKSIIKRCLDAGLHAMSIPSVDDLMRQRAQITQLRDIDLQDLIGRDPVEVDTAEIGGLIRRRVVMVTGAGGSIGSELCVQIARFEPAQLLLVDSSEFALYKIDQAISEEFPDVEVKPLAADVRDAAYLEHLFSKYRPAIVFHAAAYKHVPLMEERNCWQAIRTNALGTYRVAKAAVEHNVEKFVLVSTDKAVNPTNVMGASKRMAELICLSLHEQQSRTHFEMVRFGNVLGSAGSVIPKFQSQIEKGGPVTVTHPEITRYFMSIPEAAQLVLQAAAMGRGGEVFVLDMGLPLKVADVAKNLIRLSGYSEESIKIEYTGLRPGEKLYEELLADSENTRQTHHAKIRIANAAGAAEGWLQAAIAWLNGPILSDDDVRRGLKRWVPEYAPAVRGAISIVNKEAADGRLQA